MSTYQVRSLEEADLIIKQHERKTKTSYALLRSTKNFGCIDVPACSNEEYEVRFDTVGVPYCGVPFFVAGLKILQCQSFKEKGARGPAKKKEIKIELTGSGASVIDGIPGDGLGAEATKATGQRTSKKAAGGRSLRVSCTATIIMKEVIYYPEFQVFEHSRNGRLGVARQLKEVLRSKSTMQKDRIIYVTVPANSDHFGHPIGTVVNMKIPSKRIYVKNDYYGPVESSSSPGSPTRRLYFPVKEEKTDSVEKKRRIASPDRIGELASYDTSTHTVLEPGREAMPPPASLKKEPDVPNKAREVREVLQSIMAFTYKSGSPEAFEVLHSDLTRARQRYLDILGRKTPQQDQPQQPAQFQQPQQQIVLVKQPVKGHQHQSPTILAPRPPSATQRALQAKQPIMRLDQDPSSLSITINAVPSSLGSGAVASLPTLQGPTLTALSSHSLSSLAALPSGSISSIPSFSTVVVPAGLQPSSVTLTIPAGSLTTLNAGSLSALNAGSLTALNAGSLTALNAGSLATLNPGSLTALNPGSLTTLNAGSLTTLNAGSLTALNTGSLTTLNAGSISSMQPVSISSLASMQSNSLSSLQANSITSFPATSLPTFTARSIAPASMGSSTAIPVGSLASIQAGALASLQTGAHPSIQSAPLPSIVAASISPLLSDSIVSIPTSSEPINRDIMSTMTVTPIPSLTIGSMSSSMPQQLPLVSVSSSSGQNTIISPYTMSSSISNSVISPYTVACSIPNTVISPYTVSSSIPNTVISPYTVSSSIPNSVISPYTVSSVPSTVISPYTVSSTASSSVLSPYVSQQNTSSPIAGVSSAPVTALPPGTIISSNCLSVLDTRPSPATQRHQAPAVDAPNGPSAASCHAGAVSLSVSWPDSSSPASLTTAGSTAATATCTSAATQQRGADGGNGMVHIHHHNTMATQQQQQLLQQQSDQEGVAKSPLQQPAPPTPASDQRGGAKTSSSSASEVATNQETSIIIEAMEAILNSHM